MDVKKEMPVEYKNFTYVYCSILPWYKLICVLSKNRIC